MSEKIKLKKKATVQESLCVACGSCLSICTRKAIRIFKGLYAQVDNELCVGCVKCEKTCPASIIKMREVSP